MARAAHTRRRTAQVSVAWWRQIDHSSPRLPSHLPAGLLCLVGEVGGAQTLLGPCQALLRRRRTDLQNGGDLRRRKTLRGAKEKARRILRIERVQRGLQRLTLGHAVLERRRIVELA